MISDVLAKALSDIRFYRRQLPRTMSDLLVRMRDLHKQATTEKSHFYTAKVVSAAMVEISRLRIAHRALEEITTACEQDCGVPDENDEDDESAASTMKEHGPIKGSALTFGMLRRARNALT